MAKPTMVFDEDAQEIRITIPVDSDARSAARPSSTGKTKVIASTGGFTSVDGTDVKVNVTATIK